MCGIIGIISNTNVVDRLLTGLKRLEYRGYDSSGIAIINGHNFECRKEVGKIKQLEQSLSKSPISGTIGIAHTRWATHGEPSQRNAHPHSSEKVSLVHNGIIENHAELRQRLVQQGYVFVSETDTEVIVHLLTDYLNQGLKPLVAVQYTLGQLKGAYSLAIIFKEHNGLMIGARHGSPLAIGYGHDEMFLGSDAVALSHLSQRLSYLEDGDIVIITQSTSTVINQQGQSVTRPVVDNTVTSDAISKEPYEHFMLKEIYEQPDVVQQTLTAYLSSDKSQINIPNMTVDWQAVERLTIVACGTAYYAGLVAKYWFERVARLPVEIDIASEFRYRQGPFPKNSVSLFISQSGETADTLAALHYAKSQHQQTLGIINVATSSLARDVDIPLLTHAGVEIGVASTKAFITQLSVLAMLSLYIGHKRGHIDAQQIRDYCQSLIAIPVYIKEILAQRAPITALAESMVDARDVLYVGRGTSYALAMEGALKLKELSYIHAEGYAAGELKHGPIALIDHNVPIIVVAPHDDLFHKTASNVEECLARHGKVIVLTDKEGQATFQTSKQLNHELRILTLPQTNVFTAPLLYTIPIQLLAYQIAVFKGTDVDQPRNLAKSVTVE